MKLSTILASACLFALVSGPAFAQVSVETSPDQVQATVTKADAQDLFNALVPGLPGVEFEQADGFYHRALSTSDDALKIICTYVSYTESTCRVDIRTEYQSGDTTKVSNADKFTAVTFSGVAAQALAKTFTHDAVVNPNTPVPAYVTVSSWVSRDRSLSFNCELDGSSCRLFLAKR